MGMRISAQNPRSPTKFCGVTKWQGSWLLTNLRRFKSCRTAKSTFIRPGRQEHPRQNLLVTKQNLRLQNYHLDPAASTHFVRPLRCNRSVCDRTIKLESNTQGSRGWSDAEGNLCGGVSPARVRAIASRVGTVVGAVARATGQAAEGCRTSYLCLLFLRTALPPASQKPTSQIAI